MTETVKSGKNSDIYSSFSRFSPEQRTKVGDYMEGFYRNFVAKVADGRHTTPERIDAVGQGRVWTGAQAKDRGLVDILGGLDTAVSIAKQRAHIPADEEVELVVYSPRRSFYEALTELGRSSSAFSSWGVLMDAAQRRAVAALAYGRRQHLINVFLWPAAQGPVRDPGETMRQGYHLLHWTTPEYTYWVVSDLGVAELREFAQLLREADSTASRRWKKSVSGWESRARVCANSSPARYASCAQQHRPRAISARRISGLLKARLKDGANAQR